MQKVRFVLFLVIVSSLVLSACASVTPTPAPVEPTAALVEPTAAPVEPTAAPEEPATTGRGGVCLGTAADALQDLNCAEITIAIENAYLPFNYIDEVTGEAGGWDYDVWEEICVRLHCTPVFVEASWEGMIQAVADGQYDAAADGITITDERAEIVAFSIGYVAIEQRLLVRIDETRITSIEDIVADPSLVLGTQTGTTNYDTALEYLPAERVQAYETFPFAVQALVAGDIDAVIIDETAGQGYQGENAEALVLVGPSLSSDQLGFIYPLGSEYVALVDLALQSMMDDGTLNEFNALYFTPTFSCNYTDTGITCGS